VDKVEFLKSGYNIMTTPFWSNDPTILFNKDYLFELIPTSTMKFERKLNALTRIIILLTIVGFLLTKKIQMLLVGAATLGLIFFLYKLRKQKITNEMATNKEGFSINDIKKMVQTTTNPVTLEETLKTNYYETNKRNPFGNVLLTDINDNPDKKPAAPAFNPDVYDEINASAKKTIQMLNPGIKNTNKQMFGDLWHNYDFENSSMRQFFSTANTRVANDQTSFANWLYKDHPSGKESLPESGIQRDKNNYRYTLY
jgi:hypothetical protein